MVRRPEILSFLRVCLDLFSFELEGLRLTCQAWRLENIVLFREELSIVVFSNKMSLNGVYFPQEWWTMDATDMHILRRHASVQ